MIAVLKAPTVSMTMEAESNHIYQGLTDQSPWVPKDYGSRGQVHDSVQNHATCPLGPPCNPWLTSAVPSSVMKPASGKSSFSAATISRSEPLSTIHIRHIVVGMLPLHALQGELLPFSLNIRSRLPCNLTHGQRELLQILSHYFLINEATQRMTTAPTIAVPS